MSASRSSEWEKELCQKHIVDAAEKLFFSNGCDGVSLDDIADEAGIDKASLSRYFKDKDALFFAVALRGARILNETYTICSRIDGDGLVKLYSMSNGFNDFAKKHPGYFRLLCLAGQERFLVTDNEDAATIGKLVTANMDMGVEAIEQGKADGSIREDLDAREAAIYMGMLQASVLNPGDGWKLICGDIDGDRLVNGLRHFIGHAIAGPYTYPSQRHDIAWPWSKR